MSGSFLKPRVKTLGDGEIRAVMSTKRREFDLRTVERRETDAFRSGMTLGMLMAALAALLAMIAAGLVR